MATKYSEDIYPSIMSVQRGYQLVMEKQGSRDSNNGVHVVAGRMVCSNYVAFTAMKKGFRVSALVFLWRTHRRCYKMGMFRSVYWTLRLWTSWEIYDPIRFAIKKIILPSRYR
jgi:hypothetical protein